jgi:hypothetical protein
MYIVSKSGLRNNTFIFLIAIKHAWYKFTDTCLSCILEISYSPCIQLYIMAYYRISGYIIILYKYVLLIYFIVALLYYYNVDVIYIVHEFYQKSSKLYTVTPLPMHALTDRQNYVHCRNNVYKILL